ncbi:MAG: aldehyde dehydrogenase family protein [Microthrixaceae bacterium]
MAQLSEREYGLIIGGESVPGAGTYDIVNPATEELVGAAPEASVDQANAAVEAAADAFATWARTKPEERTALLDRAADPRRRARRGAGATGSRRDRRHPAHHLDHPGSPGGRPSALPRAVPWS